VRLLALSYSLVLSGSLVNESHHRDHCFFNRRHHDHFFGGGSFLSQVLPHFQRCVLFIFLPGLLDFFIGENCNPHHHWPRANQQRERPLGLQHQAFRIFTYHDCHHQKKSESQRLASYLFLNSPKYFIFPLPSLLMSHLANSPYLIAARSNRTLSIGQVIPMRLKRSVNLSAVF
jgi:hypothetical protein